MPVAAKRTQVWLTTLGDWSWPGTAREGEIAPPSWVPAVPPTAAAVATPGAAAVAAPRTAVKPRRVALAGALSLLATGLAVLALGGPQGIERLVGRAGGGVPVVATPAPFDGALDGPLPTLVPVSSDTAGSAIDHTNYFSPALGKGGAFYVYLPPGYAATTRHYPVVYLLPGYKQFASAFLEIGLQRTLDALIARHEVPPMIAVVIQGGPGAPGWSAATTNRWEPYVLEVQTLVDRMLPTIAQRDGRAIAGDSMGGYGAMNIALENPYRFGVVESWLSFFNGLERKLRSARPVIEGLGLHAFVYGASGDRITDPSRNAPFAAALRAAGADAHSAVYGGEHNLETVEAHLAHGLTFAGRALKSSAG
jgi:enterochelin esterase-like enzyme